MKQPMAFRVLQRSLNKGYEYIYKYIYIYIYIYIYTYIRRLACELWAAAVCYLRAHQHSQIKSRSRRIYKTLISRISKQSCNSTAFAKALTEIYGSYFPNIQEFLQSSFGLD